MSDSDKLNESLADILRRIEQLERHPVERIEATLDRVEAKLDSLDRRWPFKEFTPVVVAPRVNKEPIRELEPMAVPEDQAAELRRAARAQESTNPQESSGEQPRRYRLGEELPEK